MGMNSSDPKLKECMRKIEALCNEYDCGGYFSLVSETHGEFRYVFPKWTALTEELDATGKVTGVRLKCKKEEKEKAELTAHFIHSNLDVVLMMFKLFSYLVDETKKKWNTEHTPFAGYKPHRKLEE